MAYTISSNKGLKRHTIQIFTEGPKGFSGRVTFLLLAFKLFLRTFYGPEAKHHSGHHGADELPGMLGLREKCRESPKTERNGINYFTGLGTQFQEVPSSFGGV